MKNLINHFILLLLFSLFFYSCTKTELENLNSTKDENVTLELAIKIAENYSKEPAFLGVLNKSDLLKKSQERKVKETKTFKDSDSIPAFYVIQFEPVGFIIISANMEDSPILAFSEINKFYVHPNNAGLREWMEYRKQKSKKLRDDKTNVVPEDIERQWDAVAPPEDEEITVWNTVEVQKGPFLATIWDQGAGYNDQAPYMSCTSTGNGRAWTGCVATAIAQIMKYWEFPSTYNWSRMPNDTWSTETAILMRDIGTYIDMVYGCDASTAFTSEARNVLVNNYGYSNSASYIAYDINLVVADLNHQRPLIFRGTGTFGGHAWVCEGYRRNKTALIHNPGTIYEYETDVTYSSLYLYMNWGWGGTSNSWYLYNDFTPSVYDFNSGRSMIYNIHP